LIFCCSCVLPSCFMFFFSNCSTNWKASFCFFVQFWFCVFLQIKKHQLGFVDQQIGRRFCCLTNQETMVGFYSLRNLVLLFNKSTTLYDIVMRKVSASLTPLHGSFPLIPLDVVKGGITLYQLLLPLIFNYALIVSNNSKAPLSFSNSFPSLNYSSFSYLLQTTTLLILLANPFI